jgi:hypothetical protein
LDCSACSLGPFRGLSKEYYFSKPHLPTSATNKWHSMSNNTDLYKRRPFSPATGQDPGPNGIPKRALKHLSRRAVSIWAQIFNAVLLTHHFPTVWKHARVISILKSGKDPALPLSYRPISLLDTIGKLFETILLAMILHKVFERGLMQDEQFGFRRRYSTSLQLTRLFERTTRNFSEKRLTGVVF